ncbi:MAG TPA: glycosyltransferase [Gemmatimonadaceae bacterium]|jgi:alpha-1,6-mannosyltransferase
MLLNALMSTEPNVHANATALDMAHDPLPVIQRRSGGLKVLDVTKWFGETSGGVRTYLQQKSVYVSRRPELHHTLVIPAARDLVTDQGNVRWYRLRGPRIPTQQQYRFLLAPRSLRRIIAAERPDVIEVGSPIVVPWLVAMASAGMKIPLLSFYHTNLMNVGSNATLTRRSVATYARWLDRLFVTTLVASDAAARELAHAGVTRTTRVTLGVDLATFSPERRAYAAETRRRLTLPTEGPLVVYAGRLAPEKSLDLAIEGWRRLGTQSRATLVIMGAGPLESDLRARAAGLSIIFRPFEDSRERVADFLAAADAYLSSGTTETFGLTALEALACGTPVVSADGGGVAEHLRRSGAGALFAPGDAASMAAALQHCFAEQSRALGAVGRAFVEREHGWDSVFDRIFDVYRSVLAS